MNIEASDYIEEPNVIEVRRRIAAFDHVFCDHEELS